MTATQQDMEIVTANYISYFEIEIRINGKNLLTNNSRKIQFILMEEFLNIL